MSFERPTREEAKKRIEDLVKKFEKNKSQYLKSSYDETNVRVEFIDKFFEALGWDVYNEKCASNDKKEVLREEDLRMNNGTKHPDYAFNDRGQILFYVEAKKPSIDIKNDKAPAYQLRRYGWNKKLAISVLTNFEWFVVYDVSIQPKEKDLASKKIKDHVKYDEYIEKFDFLYDTFSWSAVYDKGTFDDYISDCKTKGTEEIDNKLLDTISEWRQNLAKRISLDNRLNAKDLNIAVQRIIDRLLFLRIAEDKQVEQYGSLLSTINNENIYKLIVKKFNEADEKYNSGLFKREKWIDELNIPDKILYDLIISMYPEGDCPYEWSILPIEILGNIYEKFLGSEIILKNVSGGKTTALIEEKPEVKKAGGVYYTPKYIVDYIVKETVGKKLENATIKDADKLKILDMACGSGSFLIGAYKYLLDWYFNEYNKNQKKYIKSGILVDTNNGIQLSIEEKKRILTNNIYGVDIDYQAVEVTKLSLFLQMLDKQGKLIDKKGQISLFMQSDNAILPNLSGNIKCGNSVVDNSVYSVQKFSQNEKDKINAFDWQIQFKDVFVSGGFDIVIGNPPYIKEKVSKEIFNPLKMNECYKGKMDFWYFFGVKALDILKNNGIVSFIATGNWNSSDGAEKFRNIILQNAKIISYIDFADYMVFDGASIQTMIYVMEKCNENNYTFPYYKIKDSKSKKEVLDLLNDYTDAKIIRHVEIDKNKLLDNIIPFVDILNDDSKILDKIKHNATIYLESCDLTEGIVPAPDEYFIITNTSKFRKNELKFIKKWQTGLKDRYTKNNSDKFIIYLSNANFRNENIKDYPNIDKHFLQFKKELKETKEKYGSAKKPYYYVNRARDERYFIDGNEKIVSQVRCPRPTCYYTKEEFYGSRGLYFIQTNKVNMKYLTALLNSNLIYYWIKHFGKLQGNMIKMESEPLKNIPIATAPDDTINEISKLVDRITILKNKKPTSAIINEINYIDNEINRIIYGIYKLTTKEIDIIENSIKV